jgi:hypothetical protein
VVEEVKVVRWYCGSVVQVAWRVKYFGGLVLRRCGCSVDRCFGGSVVWWFSGSVVLWFSASVVQEVKVLRRFCASVV